MKLTSKTEVITSDPWQFRGIAYINGKEVATYGGDQYESRAQVRSVVRESAKKMTCKNCGAWAINCTCGEYSTGN